MITILLPSCQVFDNEKKYQINLMGNYSEFFGNMFEQNFSGYNLFDNFFLTPLSVQFRKGDKEFLWLDWNAAEGEKTNQFSERFQQTILDSIHQAVLEISRHTNEFEISVIVEKEIHPLWVESIKQRLQPAFSVSIG